MGLKYARPPGGPNCYESPDVRVVDGERDIPYEGRLYAVLAQTDSERDCRRVGMIFDEKTALIVDCLHDDLEIAAFWATCRENLIDTVNELPDMIAGPCPPPRNQAQVADWADTLFKLYRPQ